MPRKRMVDPQIWTNLQLAEVSVLERYLYIGLLSNADDDGRLRGDPLYVRAIVFPYDTIDKQVVAKGLQRLNDMKLIQWYEVDGVKYIQHPNWDRYQYIRDRRPSTLPPPKGYTPPSTPPSTVKQQQSKTIQSNIPSDGPPSDATPEEIKACLKRLGMTVNSIAAVCSYGKDKVVKAIRLSEGKKSPAGYIYDALRKGWV